MSDSREFEAEPHFTRPIRQIVLMLVTILLVGGGLYIARGTIAEIFFANPYLNGLISFVFVLGVLACFFQVFQLMSSVGWIVEFVRTREGLQAPSLLAPLATLLRSRGSSMHISSTSARSILDSVGSRVDEDREMTRYLGSTLIFLGLLGTFYGLATTVPALVETIRSLTPEEGEPAAHVFERLQQGLESQLGGMGTAFSSSLLGLAGSLVVGLLELFAGHGQNRFYRELEEWLSSITRLGFAGSDEGSGGGDAGMLGQMADHVAMQIERLTELFANSEASRIAMEEQMNTLTHTLADLADKMGGDRTLGMLAEVTQGQKEVLDRLAANGGDAIDAESRMRLRSIDVQLLRILEELSAGRQETVADLRGELAAVVQALAAQKGSGDQGSGG